MNACTKCGSKEEPTQHHVHPVVFFKQKRDGLKVCLCVTCHRRLEANILAVEAFVHGKPIGQRYRLDRTAYERILRTFVGDRKIIYLTT